MASLAAEGEPNFLVEGMVGRWVWDRIRCLVYRGFGVVSVISRWRQSVNISSCRQSIFVEPFCGASSEYGPPGKGLEGSDLKSLRRCDVRSSPR